MNFHYISQTEITLEKYLAWATNPIGKKALKKKRTATFISIAGLAVSLAGGVFCLKFGYKEFALLYLAFFAAFIYKSTIGTRKAHEKTYRSTLDAVDGAKWLRTITFGSNVQVTDNNSTTTFKYSDFRRVGENENYYLLYRNEDIVLRVEKGSFTTGDESKFREYLSSRIKNRI